MAKWYDNQPKVVVEYPPYLLTFTLGFLQEQFIHNTEDVISVTARVKSTASTYIQDRWLLDSLNCEFHTRENGSIYKVVLQ